jgi:hypothetical protein
LETNDISPALKRFINWTVPDDNYERTDFQLFDVLDGLQSLAMDMNLNERQFDFVMALHHACFGVHPKFRLNFERPRKGSSFSRVHRIEAGQAIVAMANEIDVAKASGVKLESAVQAAMAKWSLSRREVFRRLKMQRQMRLAEFEINTEMGYLTGSVPEGFKIAPDGTLVQSD